jgi:hypothetical protein
MILPLIELRECLEAARKRRRTVDLYYLFQQEKIKVFRVAQSSMGAVLTSRARIGGYLTAPLTPSLSKPARFAELGS